jgi:hypothetical protein
MYLDWRLNRAPWTGKPKEKVFALSLCLKERFHALRVHHRPVIINITYQSPGLSSAAFTKHGRNETWYKRNKQFEITFVGNFLLLNFNRAKLKTTQRPWGDISHYTRYLDLDLLCFFLASDSLEIFMLTNVSRLIFPLHTSQRGSTCPAKKQSGLYIGPKTYSPPKKNLFLFPLPFCLFCINLLFHVQFEANLSYFFLFLSFFPFSPPFSSSFFLLFFPPFFPSFFFLLFLYLTLFIFVGDIPPPPMKSLRNKTTRISTMYTQMLPVY